MGGSELRLFELFHPPCVGHGACWSHPGVAHRRVARGIVTPRVSTGRIYLTCTRHACTLYVSTAGLTSWHDARGTKMTDNTREMCQQQADNTRDLLAVVWQAIDHGEECDAGERSACTDCDEYVHALGLDSDAVGNQVAEAAREYLEDMPLELVWERGEPFAVVLGTGGPHVEVTGGGRASGSGYQVDVYWAGERATARGAGVTRTGDYFREYAAEAGE